MDVEPYGPGDSEYAAGQRLLRRTLPQLAAAVRARFDDQPPMNVLQEGDDPVEVWDAGDFDPWETLDWETVRVLRYRQHKRDGTVIQAEWLTNFSIAKLGSLSFYRIAKSRWEIENQGFNEGKNRYGMEHICHPEPNSMLIVWLLILLAMVTGLLYRQRFLHRGDHAIRSAMDLVTYLWLSLGSGSPLDTS